MAKSYVIMVEFHESIDGRAPVTQWLDVYSSGPEFDVLIHALNDSQAVAQIQVSLKNPHGGASRLTRNDIGIHYDHVLEKVK